jgi:hypothetical protein
LERFCWCCCVRGVTCNTGQKVGSSRVLDRNSMPASRGTQQYA